MLVAGVLLPEVDLPDVLLLIGVTFRSAPLPCGGISPFFTGKKDPGLRLGFFVGAAGSAGEGVPRAFFASK